MTHAPLTATPAMRVVVFGATGDQGSAQVRALARAGHDPVAVSRRPQELAVDGRRIETFAADFADLPSLAVSWICHDDLAALMIAALARPELAGRSFAVGGAETVCLPQLADILGRAWNRPLGWESQSIDDFCQRMRQVFEGRSSLEADRL